MRLNALLVALALIASVWAVQSAQANFGQAQGFSGRSGATCVACHDVPPVPTAPATAILEGLPAEGWTPGETYTLTLGVEGGPTAMPDPQPQGGFDIAADAGRFSIVPGTEALMRPIDDLEVSYTADGTLMRQWQVLWSAPDLSAPPKAAQLWLAVLSANGNHVIAAGLPDGGERFDSADNLTVLVPPSDVAWTQWRAMPLASPSAEAIVTDKDVAVSGRHLDGNATTLAWRLDGGDWMQRETAAAWKLALADLDAGRHTLDLRSEGAQRVSPTTTLTFQVEGLLGPLTPNETPAPSAPALLLLTFALAIALRKSAP